MTVAEARKALEESELESLTSQDVVIREAINAVEQDGIVFIDEIDKIVTSSGYRYGAFGWGWGNGCVCWGVCVVMNGCMYERK